MAPSENNDLKRRIEAWRHFGSRELDDCREFHFRIGERRWHGENAILQPTWKKLLLTLMGFLGRPTDEQSRLNYQRDEWGRQPSETCVIELSGLAAHSLSVDRDRETFRAARVKEIRSRIHSYEPAFVIMYGKSRNCREAWKEILDGTEAIAEEEFHFARFQKYGSTILASTPAPTSWGPTNESWIELGSRLRRLVKGLPRPPHTCAT